MHSVLEDYEQYNNHAYKLPKHEVAIITRETYFRINNKC